MPRCRPGDIAVVVRTEFPENLGKLVDVLHQLSPTTLALHGHPPEQVAWECRPVGSPLIGRTRWGEVKHGVRVFAPDDVLRPLRPGDEPEAVPELTPADLDALRELAEVR